MIGDVLAQCFPNGVPDRIAQLVNLELADRFLVDYKLNPVLCFGADRPPRVAYSAQGEPTRWAEQVQQLWPNEQLGGFLARSAAEGRRMVDTDGSSTAVVYLDDLQDVEHEIQSEHPVLCACVHLPEATVTMMTRHTEPPLHLLPPPWKARVQDLLDRGASGLWGVRTQGNALVGVLWVTESRWRNNPQETVAIIEEFGPPPQWHSLRSVAERHGGMAYPDGVELRPDGSLDVTVGFLAAGMPGL